MSMNIAKGEREGRECRGRSLYLGRNQVLWSIKNNYYKDYKDLIFIFLIAPRKDFQFLKDY